MQLQTKVEARQSTALLPSGQPTGQPTGQYIGSENETMQNGEKRQTDAYG